jgi:hypothetical protein
MLVVGIFAGFLAHAARADTLTASLHFQYENAKEVALLFDGSKHSYLAGPFTSVVFDGKNVIEKFQSYCVDLMQYSRAEPTSVELLKISGIFDPSGEKGDVYARDIGAAAWLAQSIKPSSPLEHAALQVALWEVVYDFDYGPKGPLGPYANASASLQSGLFQLLIPKSDPIFELAAKYLQAAWEKSQYRETAGLMFNFPPAGRGPYSQDQITNSRVVPEPSSLVLLGLGAIGFVAVISKRRNRA